jgi:two-component system sensor histidine kinase YesM
MRRLFNAFVSLTIVVIILTVSTIAVYQVRYRNFLHNITTVSEFNQDFKEEIDLKMYYYVVGSRYSEGLPVAEVLEAEKLASSLIESTTDKDSLTAITSVLDLCKTLETQMQSIAETESYDDRQIQLENNIYVLTSLIQEYMYDYLYFEAVQLNEMQNEIQIQLIIEIAVILALVAFAVVFLARYTARITKSVADPVEKLGKRIKDIGGGDLTVKEPVRSDIYEIKDLSVGMENMVARMDNLMKESKDKQESLRKAELALLQAQINPHFLYNTLDTIIWLIEAGKSDDAVEMVANLSSFFRSSLSNGEDIISLGDEEKQVISYLQIQQVRYKDILTFSVDIDPDIKGVRMPKLTLQPLVENALYHGVKLKRAAGHISVTGRLDGEDIVLTVTDDGAGMTEERLIQIRQSLESKERVGFGLTTVHERLQLFSETDTVCRWNPAKVKALLLLRAYLLPRRKDNV